MYSVCVELAVNIPTTCAMNLKEFAAAILCPATSFKFKIVPKFDVSVAPLHYADEPLYILIRAEI